MTELVGSQARVFLYLLYSLGQRFSTFSRKVPPSHKTINLNPQVNWQSRGFHIVASQ